ncbi:hypothetical protein CHOED_025 [Vibrio phage CHOED]|uniref:hypothetical protein n=1 Tax=Vibrio phage CHOED TaxID=1458716 RepID=UPI00042EFBCB|nr:hypothetical protein CHOED_025 [Vibrio phage CHOED]AHK11885.1 hypothetical protein CHOED_025 [Vibrio phage CHOED]
MTGEVERIKCQAKAIGICHDPVNDMVMLFKVTPGGSLMETQRFPQVNAMTFTPVNETLKSGIELATGTTIKSVQFLQSYMEGPDVTYTPCQVFYVTFDSRLVEPSDNIRLLTAKQLYQEVQQGLHDDMAVIYGAHHLKMLHHNIIK